MPRRTCWLRRFATFAAAVVFASSVGVAMLTPATSGAAVGVAGWLSAIVPPGVVVDGPQVPVGGEPVACVPRLVGCVAAVVRRTPGKTGGATHVSFIVTRGYLSTWSLAPRGPAGFQSVTGLSCAAPRWCMAVGLGAGARPKVAVSTDAGRHWSLRASARLTDAHAVPAAVSCTGAATCVMVGSSSARGARLLAVTHDRGASWTLLPARAAARGDGLLNAVACHDSAHCVAVGEAHGSATVLSTADGGRRWTASSSPLLAELAPLDSVSCPTALTCVAGGTLASGTTVVAITHDGGRSFTADVLWDNTGAIDSISCGAPAHCWATTAGQVALLGTADHGAIWQPGPFAPADQQSSPGRVQCATRDVCVATTAVGMLVTGDDGGIRPSSGPTEALPGQVPPGSVSAVTAMPSAAGVSVDQAEATQVATTLWNERSLAAHDRDPSALALIESGSALAVDQHQCWSVCPAPPLATLSQLQVVVPQETTWPASFFAVATYTDGCPASPPPCDDLFVASQASEGAPWTISFYSHNAVAVPIISAAPAQVPPDPTSSLLQAYGQLLLSLKQSNVVPAGGLIAASAFTNGLGAGVFFPESSAKADGYTYDLTYSPEPAPTYTVESNYGLLQCGVVGWDEVDTPLPGLELAQPIDRSLRGPAVRPGSYQQVETQGLHQVCLVTNGAGPGSATVFSDWSGPVADSGTS